MLTFQTSSRNMHSFILLIFLLRYVDAQVSIQIPQTTVPPPDPTDGMCPLILANTTSSTALRVQFQNAAQAGRFVIYFNLKVVYPNTSEPVPFSVSNTDTFLPSLWLWATNSGKNLLRMPLDYSIMSLGLLTINTYGMDILLNKSTQDCFVNKNYTEIAHVIAQFIAQNITANGTTVGVGLDGPVVCRSAFAFDHRMFGERGIGFKCCSAPMVAGPLYNCSTPYSDAWTLVWYGPTALLCWVYLIAFVHLYKLYKNAFNKRKIRELSGLEQTIDEIKHDVVSRIVAMSKRLVRIQDVVDLVALRERCGMLDILGIDKGRQAKVVKILTVIFVTSLLCAYYVVVGVFVYIYKIQLEPVLQQLKDTQTAYINVIGHFGWLFLRDDVQLYRYAVFEMIYTIAIPFFATIVYLSISYRGEPAPPADPAVSHGVCPGTCATYFHRIVRSGFGKFFQGAGFVLFLIYIVFVAGVFLSYIAYFTGLGVFANIGVVSPWIIPLGICFHFFVTVFDPATNLYKNIKDTFFTVCMNSFKQLVIRQEKVIFIPRTLLEQFYIPRSKSVLYTCLLRIMWVVAFMILLVLVILTLQYPYYNQTSSLVSFLSVQVVFILPLLAQVMMSNQPNNPLEQAILTGDVEEYIKKFIKLHPEIIPPPKPRKKDSKRGPSDGEGGVTSNDSTTDSGRDEQVELGVIAGEHGDGLDGASTDGLVGDRQKILRTNSPRAANYVTT